MKTFSEFIIESEQQSGALAAHLARTAADRASQSGTVGGTEKDFKKFSRAFLSIDKDISFSFLTRAHLVAISAKSDRNLQTRYWQEPIEDWEKFIKRLEEVWKKKYKVSDVNAS